MARTILVWVLTVPTAALMLIAALSNTMGGVQALQFWGEDAALQRVFVGVCELVGVIALFVPRLSFWGSALLVMVLLGVLPMYVSRGLPLVLLSALLGSTAIIGALRNPSTPMRHSIS